MTTGYLAEGTALQLPAPLFNELIPSFKNYFPFGSLLRACRVVSGKDSKNYLQKCELIAFCDDKVG